MGSAVGGDDPTEAAAREARSIGVNVLRISVWSIQRPRLSESGKDMQLANLWRPLAKHEAFYRFAPQAFLFLDRSTPVPMRTTCQQFAALP
jgi:hypothetical protein